MSYKFYKDYTPMQNLLFLLKESNHNLDSMEISEFIKDYFIEEEKNQLARFYSLGYLFGNSPYKNLTLAENGQIITSTFDIGKLEYERKFKKLDDNM
jgi:hypothetical protein